MFNAGRAQRRAVAALVAAMFANAATFVAMGFAAYGAVIALSRRMPPEQAVMIVAGGAVAMALLAGLCIWLTMRSARREVATAVSTSAVDALAPAAMSVAVRNARLVGLAAAAGIAFRFVRGSRS